MSRLALSILLVFSTSFFALQAQNPVDELTNKKIIIDGNTYYLYQVEPAEGIYRVSKKFGVSTQEIIKHNPEAAEGLKLGQVLKIPVIEGRNSSPVELDKNDDILYHKVEKGQTLFFISRKYNVSIADIVKLNPGAENGLRVGMDLKIPTQLDVAVNMKRDSSYVYHEVQPKETLFFLSKKYHTTVQEIIAANPGLESGIIQIGTTLRIPSAIAFEDNKTILAMQQEDARYTNDDGSLEDDEFVYHKLKQGETLYSLALKYNLRVPYILEANDIKNVTDIETGYLVRIPKNKIIDMEGKDSIRVNGIKVAPEYIVHVTGKKESLSYIADLYGISSDSIRNANPQIESKRWIKLKKNSKINIPRQILIVDEKPKKLSFVDSLHQEFLKDSMFLSTAFIEGCDTAGHQGAINIAFMGPFYLDRNDSINLELETDANGYQYYKERSSKKIFPQINIFREFYFGSLLAIDELKKKGLSINVYTYDVMREPGDTKSLPKVLAKPELKNMDFIFGPAHSSQVGEVAKFCEENKIRMVLPYGNMHESVHDNPYVYSLFSNEKLLYPDIVNHITDMYKDANFIVVKGKDSTDRQYEMAKLLKQNIYRKKWDENSHQSYFEVDFEKDGIYGVEQVLDKDKQSIVIITSNNRKLFNKLLPSLYNLKSKKSYPISLVGYPEYMRNIGNDLEYIFSLNTLIFSQYYINYEDSYTTSVLNKYKNWYGGEPTVRHPSQGMLYPNNGLLGYDATLFFLSAFKAYGSQFERCMQYHRVKATESDFNFKRENTWGGFSNRNINYIQFSEDFELKKLNN